MSNVVERDEHGRIKPGKSLNPGGRKLWERKVRRALERGSLEAAKLLVGVVAGTVRDVCTIDGEDVEIAARLRDRIKASEILFSYVLSKPKQELHVSGANPLEDITRDTLLKWANADEEPQ